MMAFELGLSMGANGIETDIRLTKDGIAVLFHDDTALAKMRQAGIDELCPKADEITPEKVTHWRESGFNVRAWGVFTPELMEQAYSAGVGGMTVNFPDLLTNRM